MNLHTVGWLLTLFLLCVNLPAQSLTEWETRYNAALTAYQQQRQKLDSLRSALDQQVAGIDQEKSAARPDRNRLSRMMSGALAISRSLKRQQQTLDSLENEIEKLRNTLYVRYSARIDSLKNLEQQSSGTQQSELQRQILSYMGKKLLMSPHVQTLSIDPAKVLALKVSTPKDSLEQAIYQDFLRRALREVNARLQSINRTRQEVATLVRLEKKSRQFLEEIGSETNPAVLSSSLNRAQSENRAVFLSNNAEVAATQRASLETLSLLLKQLTVLRMQESPSPNLRAFSAEARQLTLEDYARLLSDVETELKQYRQIVEDKLEALSQIH